MLSLLSQPRSLSFESQTIALNIIEVFLIMYKQCGECSDPIIDLEGVNEVLESFVISPHVTVMNRQHAEVLLGIIEQQPLREETGVIDQSDVMFRI